MHFSHFQVKLKILDFPNKEEIIFQKYQIDRNGVSTANYFLRKFIFFICKIFNSSIIN